MAFLRLRNIWQRNVAIPWAASVAAWHLGGGGHSGGGDGGGDGDGDGDNDSSGDSDMKDRRLEGENGKELLALQTSEDQRLECLLRIFKEGCIVLGRRYGNSCDEALRVTRRARETR